MSWGGWLLILYGLCAVGFFSILWIAYRWADVQHLKELEQASGISKTIIETTKPPAGGSRTRAVSQLWPPQAKALVLKRFFESMVPRKGLAKMQP